MKELAAALMQAHMEMPVIENNAVNPHFRSNYATLDTIIKQCRPVFAKHGFAVVEFMAGDLAQNLTLLHVESGNSIDSYMKLACKDPSNPQQLKSAQTYARRMLWLSATGVCPVDEDDDANKATEEPPKQDPIKLLKPHEAEIIAYAASKGKIIAGVHELTTKQLQDAEGMLKRALEYAKANTKEQK